MGYPGGPRMGYPGVNPMRYHGPQPMGYPGFPPSGYPGGPRMGFPPMGYPGAPPMGYPGASPYLNSDEINFDEDDDEVDPEVKTEEETGVEVKSEIVDENEGEPEKKKSRKSRWDPVEEPKEFVDRKRLSELDFMAFFPIWSHRKIIRFDLRFYCLKCRFECSKLVIMFLKTSTSKLPFVFPLSCLSPSGS